MLSAALWSGLDGTGGIGGLLAVLALALAACAVAGVIGADRGMGGVLSRPARTGASMRFSRPELAKEFGRFCLRLQEGDTKGMTPLAGSEGGYLLPSAELSAEIARMVMSVGFAAQYGRPVPLGPGGFAQARRLGGATAYWKTGGIAVNKSTPSLGRMEMRPETLMALVDVDIELEEDTVEAFGNFMAAEFAYALAYKEDEAAIKGDGSKTYGGIVGILNSDRVSVVTGTETVPGQYVRDDLFGMESAIWEGALTAARWLMSRSGLCAIRKGLIEATTGGVGTAWQYFMDPARRTLMGYDSVLSGMMPTVAAEAMASTKWLAFGDFRLGLYYGRRGPIAIDFSEAPGWTTYTRCWRAVERVDIAVDGFTAAEIAANADLANPIAVLTTAAA